MNAAEAAGDPWHNAADVVNPDGQRPILLICEHASPHIPRRYRNLGLEDSLLDSHIVWDPGALGVAVKLSRLLDSPLVAGKISRLVFDCNRPPEAPSAITAMSEIHDIPGNTGISDAERERRTREVYEPFHSAVAAMKSKLGDLQAIVTVHSYTRIYLGQARDDSIGILHDRDSRMAGAMLAIGKRQGRYKLARNHPYGPGDGVMHTVQRHALPHGHLNAMIEICNDWIRTDSGQEALASYLAVLTEAAIEQIAENTEELHAACR